MWIVLQYGSVKGEGGAPSRDKGQAGWFHTKKEKYISLDFSCTTIDFDPSPNLSPKRREALKLSFIFSLLV
ncbi:hypothetical protein NSTCB13_07142 [Nostoc sp. DSM 114160]|jgi:hypothetical protein